MTRAIAPLETEIKLGPCMLALTEKQRHFVWALAEDGGANQTRAAIVAGYEGGNGGQRVAGHRLAHDPKIRAAIQEVALAGITADVLLARAVLHEVAENRSASAGDRLKAAAMILNRGGLHEKTEHKVVVEDTRDQAALVAEIKGYAARLDLDPRKLLGQAGIIDAEFEVVEKQDWE